MLLAIDAGNTNVVFSLMDGMDAVQQWRMETADVTDPVAAVAWLNDHMAGCGIDPEMISGAILSSVVPVVNSVLVDMVADMTGHRLMIVGADDLDLGIKLNVDNPAEVGADRIVNALAAQQDHDCPLVIVDFGTATTFDVVDKSGAYVGGVIAPGIRLSLKALHDAAAKLPLIEPAEPTGGVIGKNTVDAMRSGLFWGYVGMIEGVVDRLQSELGHDVKVIATGGLAPTFEGKTRVIDTVDQNLTLKGLALIYERNYN